MNHSVPFRKAALVLSTIAFGLPALAEMHVEAKNCEIFVDRITAYQGSHALRAVSVFVKVLPQRLDGDVVETGFRNQRTDIRMGSVDAWKNLTLQPFNNSSDYFQVNLGFSHDYGSFGYTGSFYVKTDKGTYYWAKAASNSDFSFDRQTHDNVMGVASRANNYNSGPETGVGTQDNRLNYFNPSRCY